MFVPSGNAVEGQGVLAPAAGDRGAEPAEGDGECDANLDLLHLVRGTEDGGPELAQQAALFEGHGGGGHHTVEVNDPSKPSARKRHRVTGRQGQACTREVLGPAPSAGGSGGAPFLGGVFFRI